MHSEFKLRHFSVHVHSALNATLPNPWTGRCGPKTCLQTVLILYHSIILCGNM